MKDITTLITQPPSSYKRPMGSGELTPAQLDSVAYFFMRLSLINRQQYDALIPDEKTASLVKREYAAHIKDFSREKIDKGVAGYHQMRQAGEKDYQFLDIDRLIGLCANGGLPDGNRAGIHKVFEPLALESDEAKEKARIAAERELGKMKSLFE